MGFSKVWGRREAIEVVDAAPSPIILLAPRI
jgi:hypothetical protein